MVTTAKPLANAIRSNVLSKAHCWILVVLAVTGCEQLGMDKEPLPSAEAVPMGGDPIPAMAPMPADVEVFNDPVVPAPADWDGSGILAKEAADNHDAAPEWTHIEAEVIEHDGVRYLVGTGAATGIDNPALAQSTAENRARHVLARYLDKKRLVNSRISGTWQDPTSGAFYARAEIEVPAGFMLPTKKH